MGIGTARGGRLFCTQDIQLGSNPNISTKNIKGIYMMKSYNIIIIICLCLLLLGWNLFGKHMYDYHFQKFPSTVEEMDKKEYTLPQLLGMYDNEYCKYIHLKGYNEHIPEKMFQFCKKLDELFKHHEKKIFLKESENFKR